MRLAAALWRSWEIRGYLTEGRAWLEHLLSLSQNSIQVKTRTRALYAAGVLADAQCDYAAVRNLFAQYLKIYRKIGDPIGLAAALNNLGNVANAQGDFQHRREDKKPLFIDVHKKIDGLTAEEAVAAHAEDLEVQGKSGVSYIKYWYDESTGRLFCFVEAPSAEAAEAVHREAHRILADEIFEVKEGF